MRKQKDKAILVGYMSRRKKNCYCPECPKDSHYMCRLSTYGGRGTSFRRYLCQDWGDRQITKDAVVVLSDTGIRKGKAVLWRVL